MSERKPLTPEEISAIVAGLNPIDWEEMEMLREMPLGERYLVSLRKSEAIRTDPKGRLP